MDCVTLKADNQAAIKIASNPINHPRTKHIDSCYHVVREMVAETGQLRVDYVKTDDMLANGLTKALGPHKHKENVKRLGLRTL